MNLRYSSNHDQPLQIHCQKLFKFTIWAEVFANIFVPKIVVYLKYFRTQQRRNGHYFSIKLQ